jgi:ATP-dependent DNA helicase PIF1
MLTRNVDINEGLVNGARGVVTLTAPSAVWVRLTNGITYKIEYYKVNPYGDIYDEDDIQHQKNEENTNIINASYIPLQLAWAISIHKSQGTTLDAVEIDLGDSIFACGQAYTALSRAKNMRSVRITSVKASSFRTHPAVLKFMRSSDTE